MDESQPALRPQLRRAISLLTSRGLRKSAAWCGELLQSFLNREEENDDHDEVEVDPESRMKTDAYLVGKTYFDLGEYERCVRLFERKMERRQYQTSGFAQEDDDDDDERPHPEDELNHLEFFLHTYSMFLSGEKRRDEEMREGDKEAANEHLDTIIASARRRLRPREKKRQQQPQLDATEIVSLSFISWLLGVCLKEKKGNDEGAREALLRSCLAYPFHWGAWLDLAQLCPTLEIYARIIRAIPHPLAESLPCRYFRAHLAGELQQWEEAVNLHTNLLAREVPGSPFAIAGLAVSKYGAGDIDEAYELFERLTAMDPFRLTNIDTLSNLLFVRENAGELSHLAARASKVDKYRAETCCAVGNYFSLKGQHTKAVAHFRRALRGNRRYLSAFTLLGHEFIELKNLPAAIECYRSAVDINPCDFRALYGLGQTYEFARMHWYAIHYYRKAALVRPGDSRMWIALGGCLESVGRVRDALKCYKRAEAASDNEGIAVQRMADIYRSLGMANEAAHYLNEHLRRKLEENAFFGPDVVEALRFLVSHLRGLNRLDEALVYAEHLQRVAGADREADALKKELQSMKTWSSSAATASVPPS